MDEKHETSYLPIYLLGVLSGVIFVISILFKFKINSSYIDGIILNYNDLVAVLLTATATIITVLGVFVGLLAIWGYSQFEKMTKLASTRHLERMLQTGKFRDELDQIILKHVSSELAKDESPFRELLREQIEIMIYTDASKRQKKPRINDEDIPFED